jgi:hypothetical protein
MLPTIKTAQIKRQFEIETGLPQSAIEEISEAFPASYGCTIHTIDRTFHCMLTHEARAKKGTFYEEK